MIAGGIHAGLAHTAPPGTHRVLGYGLVSAWSMALVVTVGGLARATD